jgi:hypothetical protein
VPGQTVEDVCRTEARFLEEVIARHPEVEGKPVVIANCQAGWQMMMTAALRPELTGPILLVGSPLSYWGGVRGTNPLRYLGGLLGGTWLTALAGDMGAGRFDGANLNRQLRVDEPGEHLLEEALQPLSKIDEEAPRYLEFETWWGTPVLMNAEEMQWIADELFIGNKLSTGQLRASDGTRIDLRNVTHRSSSSARGAMTSLHLSRRSAGSATSTITRARSSPPVKPSSTRCTTRSDTSASSSREGCQQGAHRVRPVHGDDRPHAAGTLRGGDHRGSVRE